MNIKCKVAKGKYVIFVENHKFSIRFPKELELSKHSFNETNLKSNTFSVTWPLSSKKRINYDFREAFFKDFILKTCYTDIPTVADENDIDTNKLFKEFDDAKKNIYFKDKNEGSCIFKERFSNPEKALILMSFGKDSLLSFGLAKEIGMDVSIFFNVDTGEDDCEFNKKLIILKRFKKDFKNKSYLLYDNTESILGLDFPDYFKDFVSSTTLLHYTLLAMPISHLEHASSILVGNEQNLSDSYINKDGIKAYVHPDQTSEFMQGFNALLSIYTNNNTKVVSLIESIYNLFEIKILYSRYPELLKYVMCCADERLNKGRWCYRCPMCAKAFLYTKAFGFDTKRIHLYKSFFGKQHKKLYPLFNKNPKRTHEKPPKVRDEQLLSFYLAYKKGAKGYLVDKFKKEFLDEAKERYEELHKIFFGIHPTASMPKKIKQDIISIYKEEINNL